MLKDNQMWRRPGKTKSWSASYNGTVFYVWTPNAPPFEQQRGYNRFAVYGHLEHGGNWSAAASELRKQGYGGTEPRGNLEGVNIDGILQQGEHRAAENDPDEFKLSEMLTNWPTEAEPIIDGWLRRGEVGNLIGGPKTYKTWMLQQCIVSVLEGKPVFGNVSIKGRVLLVDYELAKGTLSKRLYNVAHAMETSVKAIDDNLTVLAKRGKAFDLDALERYVDSRGLQFDLIAVDPLFRLFPQGMDENSNADVAALYGRLINLAERAQSALLVVHHMSKGSQADKAVTDLGAGAGSQSRACDLHLTLRQHEEEGCAVVAGVVRSFKPFEPFCLRYEWPIWQDAPDLDSDSLARPGKRKKETEPVVHVPEPEAQIWTAEDFVEAFVTAQPRSKDVIFLRANQGGVRDHIASKLLNAAEELGLIYRSQHPGDKRRPLFSNAPVIAEPEPEEEAEPEEDEIETAELNEAELHVRLSASRKKVGMSIRDAAEALGVSKSILSCWEKGPVQGKAIPLERAEHIESWLKSIGGYGQWHL